MAIFQEKCKDINKEFKRIYLKKPKNSTIVILIRVFVIELK